MPFAVYLVDVAAGLDQTDRSVVDQLSHRVIHVPSANMISLPTCKISALLPGREEIGSNGAEDGQSQPDLPSIFGHVDSLSSLREP